MFEEPVKTSRGKSGGWFGCLLCAQCLWAYAGCTAAWGRLVWWRIARRSYYLLLGAEGLAPRYALEQGEFQVNNTVLFFFSFHFFSRYCSTLNPGNGDVQRRQDGAGWI